jgi:hypothetical protein
VLSNNFYLDITMSNLVKKLGKNAFALLPRYPKTSPHILDNAIKFTDKEIFDIADFSRDTTNYTYH